MDTEQGNVTACNNIRDKNGNILIEKEDKAERWKEYLKGLYNGGKLSSKAIEE